MSTMFIRVHIREVLMHLTISKLSAKKTMHGGVSAGSSSRMQGGCLPEPGMIF
jgi:hypothetical protein